MKNLTPPPNPLPIKWRRGIKIILFGLMLFITGCAQIAPAQLPPRLNDQQANHLPTLESPFIITSNTYANSAFSVIYPHGWRVVSSAGFAPPSAVFVSPDETYLIAITTETDATLAPPDPTIPYDEIKIQKGDVWIIGIAPITETDWESFLPIYEQMVMALVVLDS